MINVLIIDDDKVLLDSYKALFSDYSIHLETALSGEEGLSKILLFKPDCVLLDLRMPNMNGVNVLRNINKLLGNIPICIHTAYYQLFNTQLQKAALDGINFEIIYKPMNFHLLRRFVENMTYSKW